MTIAFKATQKTIAANYERVFDFDCGCGCHSVFVDVYTSLRMTFQIYGRDTLGVDNFWELNTEHIYTFIVDSSSARAYRDGQLMGTSHGNHQVPSATRSSFKMGGSSCMNIHKWDADVKWFSVWGSALTATEIAALSAIPALIPGVLSAALVGNANEVPTPLWHQSFECGTNKYTCAICMSCSGYERLCACTRMCACRCV